MPEEAIAQVINDNIEDRIELVIDIALTSNTADCSLQWSCLNHDLTKKCIQYHNDQWFFFKANKVGRNYLNISEQDCRDLRGVQILVIDGQPCEPDSYKILKCISLGNHDDVFIDLDSLESQKEFLVLIDGYLHDYCHFQIEFSDKPKGFPLAEKGIVHPKINILNDYHLEIYWSIPDSLATQIEKYEIYRRHETEFKSVKIHEELQGYNAYGEPRLDFVIEDILPDYGVFHYIIVGAADSTRHLVTKYLIQYPRPKPSDSQSRDWLELELNYPNPSKLKISIYDATQQSLLNWYSFNYNSGNRYFEAFIKDYIDEGIFYYRIEVENLDTKQKKNHLILK